jgi:hypothetical protein
MAQSDDRIGPLSQAELDRHKWEVAADLGLDHKIRSAGWGEMTSRECGRTGGRIGGSITKVLVRMGEEALARGAAPPK